MKHTVLLLATTTLALGGTSAYLWQEIREERVRTEAVQARVTELERQIQNLARPMPEPPPPPLVAQLPPEAPPAPRAPAPPPKSREEGAPEATFGRADPSEFFAREQERLQDPEYRALRREQQKMGLLRMHSDVGVALDLSEEEVDELLDLLTEQQLQAMTNRPPIRPGESGSQPPPEWFRKLEENQRKNQAEIKSLLGDTKYQEWQDYQQSMGARMQVNNLRSILEGSPEPLRQDQYQSLVKVIADEQRLEVSERMELLKNRPPGPLSHADQMAMIEQSLERTAERNQRTRDAAAPYLSSGQLERFEKVRKQQLEMQRLNLKMMRARGDAGLQMFSSGGSTIMLSPADGAFAPGTVVTAPAPPPRQ